MNSLAVDEYFQRSMWTILVHIFWLAINIFKNTCWTLFKCHEQFFEWFGYVYKLQTILYILMIFETCYEHTLKLWIFDKCIEHILNGMTIIIIICMNRQT